MELRRDGRDQLVLRALVVSGAAGSLLTTGCGGPSKPPPAGTVELRFSVADTVRTSPNLKNPLTGVAYGAIFLTEDVSIGGPRTGADSFGDVAVDGVDCRAGVSDQSLVMSLAPGQYTFLGFFDVNANGSVTRDPDAGDPATLPFTNKFEIVDTQQTKRLVLFDLLYN